MVLANKFRKIAEDKKEEVRVLQREIDEALDMAMKILEGAAKASKSWWYTGIWTNAQDFWETMPRVVDDRVVLPTNNLAPLPVRVPATTEVQRPGGMTVGELQDLMKKGGSKCSVVSCGNDHEITYVCRRCESDKGAFFCFRCGCWPHQCFSGVFQNEWVARMADYAGDVLPPEDFLRLRLEL